MTAPPSAAPAEAVQNIIQPARSVLLRSLRYWPVMAVTVVLSVVAFAVAPRIREPVYRSEVVLAIRQNLQTDTVLGSDNPAGESRRTRNARLSDLFYARPNLRWVIEQENLSPATVARLGMAEAIEELRARTSFSAGESNSIVIAYDDRDPALVQRVARRLGESLQRQVSRDSTDRAESTRKFLEQEQAKLAKELQQKEQEYAEFLTLHPEFVPDARTGQTAAGAMGALARTGAEDADGATPMRRQADRLRRRLDQLRSPRSGSAVTAAPTAVPQLTQESREAIVAAEREVQQAGQELEARQLKYTGLHPDLLAAQARLAAAQDRLARTKAAAEAYAPPVDTLPIPVSASAPTRQELERQLLALEAARAAPRGAASAGPAGAAQLSSHAGAIVNLETQWASLSRDMAALRERFESLQRRLFRAVIVASAESSGGSTQLVVAEDASLPRRPVKRGRLRTGGSAALVVLALGTFLTLGLGYLDQRIVGEWDLGRLKLGPIALVVPRVERRPEARRRR